MIKAGLHIVFFFHCFALLAQNDSDSLALHFHLEFNRLPFETAKKYVSYQKDTLTIETFKCYISAVQIEYEDKSADVQENSFHLLDFDNPGSFIIPIAKKSNRKINKIRFTVGLDSLTNTSGAMAGDLDPLNGMYWAWQSGYINTKIEGKSRSCATRKNEFQFHIGGYRSPYYTGRELMFVVSEKTGDTIPIGIDLNSFFSKLELSHTNTVMIPGEQAMRLADCASQMFYLQ